MREVLGDDRFVTFICDSVAARLGDAGFVEALERWCGALGDDRFVTFIKSSVAARLGVPGFVVALEHWRGVLGDDTFVTFVSRNSVASRVLDDEFMDLVVDLMVELGQDETITLLVNGVASRLEASYHRVISELIALIPADAVAIRRKLVAVISHFDRARHNVLAASSRHDLTQLALIVRLYNPSLSAAAIYRELYK